MAAMAAQEVANIFASDMVSTDFILTRVSEIRTDPSVVRLEVEDLNVNSHREKLMPVFKGLLMAGDRQWQSVMFRDSVDADGFKEWLGLKRDAMADFAETFTLDNDTITFQAKLEVRAETSLKAFVGLLKVIKRQRGICDLELGGVLFGYEGDPLKTVLADNINEDNKLTGLIQVNVSFGSGNISDYTVKLDDTLRAAKAALDKTVGDSDDLPAAPLRRVKSAAASTSMMRAGLRQSPEARSKSPIRPNSVRAPRRIARCNTGDGTVSTLLRSCMSSNSLSSKSAHQEGGQTIKSSTSNDVRTRALKRSKSALLEPRPDFDWAAQGVEDDHSDLSSDDESNASSEEENKRCSGKTKGAAKVEPDEPKPCFRWEKMGDKMCSTGCISGDKESSKELRHSHAKKERPRRNASNTGSVGSLASASKKKPEKAKASSSAILALMASVDSASQPTKSSRRVKGLRSNKTAEPSPLRRVKSEGVPLHEMRRIASQSLANKNDF